MASIASKVFAITGGASGMGLATAKHLARLNARAVCIGDFNTSNFDSVRAAVQNENRNTQVVLTKLDVSSKESVDNWISSIIKEFSSLDGAVNAAGFPQPAGRRKPPTILEETEESWNRVWDVNLHGIFHCTKSQIKAMLSLERSPRAIVNIASLGAYGSRPDCYAYAGSKRACVGFSASVAKDVVGFGIRVNSISPAATQTPMLTQFFERVEDAAAWAPLGLTQPEDIAEMAAWLLSEDSRKIFGNDLWVGGCAP